MRLHEMRPMTLVMAIRWDLSGECDATMSGVDQSRQVTRLS